MVGAVHGTSAMPISPAMAHAMSTAMSATAHAQAGSNPGGIFAVTLSQSPHILSLARLRRENGL
nr:hypothetical protein [uncultured Desulfobulbus sp.]